MRTSLVVALVLSSLTLPPLQAQTFSFAAAQALAAPRTSTARIRVIIDTDIGDDVDDAFALGLALSSPELQILGVTTAWGDTHLRARLADRLLVETSRSDIPVAEGIPTPSKRLLRNPAGRRVALPPEVTRKRWTSFFNKFTSIPAKSP